MEPTDPPLRLEGQGQDSRRYAAEYDLRSPRLARRERSSASAIFAERPGHGLGFPVDNGDQHPRRPVGNTPALLPLLKSPHIQTETLGKLPPAQPQPLAERDNPAGGGIVDDPARQCPLTANMAENLAQTRFNLDSRLAAFHPSSFSRCLLLDRG